MFGIPVPYRFPYCIGSVQECCLRYCVPFRTNNNYGIDTANSNYDSISVLRNSFENWNVVNCFQLRAFLLFDDFLSKISVATVQRDSWKLPRHTRDSDSDCERDQHHSRINFPTPRPPGHFTVIDQRAKRGSKSREGTKITS